MNHMKAIFEISYLDNGNMKIQLTTKDADFSTVYDDLMDAFGDADIVSCNEINEDFNDMLVDSDGDVFFMDAVHIASVLKVFDCVLVKQGKLKKYIDLSNESHIEFIKWFFNTDKGEEAIRLLNLQFGNI